MLKAQAKTSTLPFKIVSTDPGIMIIFTPKLIYWAGRSHPSREEYCRLINYYFILKIIRLAKNHVSCIVN
jgi:hypothetical protein